MLKVGLTGGIGAGKSEVSRLLVKYGAVLIDSDRIAREVVEPGTPGLAAVVEEFGPGVLTAEGTLDRPALGALVFADAGRLAALNAIVHPWSAPARPNWNGRLRGRRRRPRRAPPHGERTRPLYDLVVVVDATAETQLERLVTLRGMTESDARARMAAQATRDRRRAVADLIVDNDGPLEALEPQVRTVWDELVRWAAAR